MSERFIEYHIPDLPGISISRVGRDDIYNYWFSGTFDGDFFELPPGYVFADASVFPELSMYKGGPVQVIGARVPVLGHDVESVVFEIDQDGIRASNLWGGFVVLRHHDALAGTQLLVLID